MIGKARLGGFNGMIRQARCRAADPHICRAIKFDRAVLGRRNAQQDQPVAPMIDHLKGKIDAGLKALRQPQIKRLVVDRLA